jgi:hypothetical protein
MQLDLKNIAERIRGLVSMSDRAQLTNAAARLGVDENDLRAALDGKSSRSALNVIGAIIRVYGLDPTWVLSGKYDQATHRVALQNDAAQIDALLQSLVTEAPEETSAPPRDTI